MHNNKIMGTVFELEFRKQALLRGLEVFPAEGDYSVVDSIVMNPAGKTYRVQTKGTSLPASEGANRGISKNKYKIIAKSGADNKKIRPTEVDILAFYIFPRDTWYIIPTIKTSNIYNFAFFLVEGSKSQWEPFRNNWESFFN